MLEFAALLSACVLARWHSVITGYNFFLEIHTFLFNDTVHIGDDWN